MTKKGTKRQHILEIAEAHVLAKGFSATFIDDIIAEAGITKSGFNYHFNDKNELARALIERAIHDDDVVLDGIFGRARELDDDPLHVFLIGLKLLAEMFRDIPNGHPGCVVATFCFAERSFDSRVRELNRQWALGWRTRFLVDLEKIGEHYLPNDDVSMEALADRITNTVEGGIVLSRASGQPTLLADQMLLLRSHIKLLFSPQINSVQAASN